MGYNLDDSAPHAAAIMPIDASIPSLPIEIHEYIISFIEPSSEITTVARCALVCRAWLPFSRYKLFHTVQLRYHRQWVCFQQLLLDHPPSIAPYLETVRVLEVTPNEPAYIDSDDDDDDDRPESGFGAGQERSWAHLALAYCAQHLTGLTYISHEHIDWTRSRVDNMLFAACDRYTALARLQLDGCTFESVFQLELLVCAFPALRVLRLLALSFRTLQRIFPCPPRGPQLTELLMVCDLDVLITLSRWLVDIGAVQTLSQLTWLPSHGGPMLDWTEEFDRLVRAIDHPLQVWLCRLPDAFQADWSGHVDLKKLYLDVDHEDIERCIRTLSEGLTLLPSCPLNELHVWMTNSAVPSSDNLPALLDRFKEIDAILARPQFDHLQKVLVDIGMEYTGEPAIISGSASTSTSNSAIAPMFPGDLTSELPAPPEPDTYGSLRSPSHEGLMIGHEIERDIEERLPRLASRGVLCVKVSVKHRASSFD